MTSAMACENALLGAGAMVNRTAMLQSCQTSAQSMSLRTREALIGATAPWNAMAIALARSGAGAQAVPTVEKQK